MRISVVIPAHNAASYIAKGIEAAWVQTVKPDEIIVGCDGCTDNTSEIARGLGAIALDLPKSNGAIARNKAAKEATGDLLFFLDADDWWQERKIERHLQVWEQHPESSVVLDRSVATHMNGTLAGWFGGRAEEGPADWRVFLSHRAWPSGSGFSVPRSKYWEIGGFNEKLIKFQDVDFWIRLVAHCGPAYTITDVLTNYLLVEGSVAKRVQRMEENLANVFAEWPFATEADRRVFRSIAYTMAIRQTAWPESGHHLMKSGFPVQNRYFWGSLLQSFKNPRPKK